MQDTRVSVAEPKDLQAIRGLLAAASLPLSGIDGVTGFLVIRNGNSLLGAVCIEDHGADILLRSLVVRPDSRHDGLGVALVSALLSRARDLGKRSTYLLTDTAAPFFERLGFRHLSIEEIPAAIQQSEEFSGCKAAGAYAMKLALDADGCTDGDLADAVRRKYSNVAKVGLSELAGESCCGSAATSHKTQVTRDLYQPEESACVPSAALGASRGCGNPLAATDIRLGDTVLDLGSGAGVDAFLAAKRVGSTGRVYGLDSTAEMIELACSALEEMGLDNVEFLKGDLESVPLPDRSIDVAISNCVISLVPDKRAVFREILRLLKPGGRLSISDIVSTAPLTPELKADLDLWLGCLGGALPIDEYRSLLTAEGFVSIEIEETRTYELESLLASKRLEADADSQSEPNHAARWDGRLLAASVTAVRPRELERISGPSAPGDAR